MIKDKEKVLKEKRNTEKEEEEIRNFCENWLKKSSWMNQPRNIISCSYSIMSRRKQSNPKPLLKSEFN